MLMRFDFFLRGIRASRIEIVGTSPREGGVIGGEVFVMKEVIKAV